MSMSRSRSVPISLFFLCLVALVVLVGCRRDEESMLDELLALEEESYKDRPIAESTIEELRESIVALEQEVARTIDVGERLITYYKMVAAKYMARELYGLAADFFRKALDLQPANRLVAYRLGVCFAQIALSETEKSARRGVFEQAEAYYLYALQLDPRYDEALYAISVLYIFELDRSLDAEVYLERLLKVESRHFSGMFLMARVYVQQGRIDDAVALYDEVVRESGDHLQVLEAENNRRELMGGAYGS